MSDDKRREGETFGRGPSGEAPPEAGGPSPEDRELAVGSRRVRLPRHRAARIALGSGLVVGGLLGFLPVLGFWMIPLGIAVLAVDVPLAARLYRRGERWVRRRLGRD